MMESSMKGRAKRRHLGTTECRSLVQSKTGNPSLTQPFNVKLSNRNSTMGLQPKISNKRSRLASPSKQQSIYNFFSVSGVISSSPQKTPLKEEEDDQHTGNPFPDEHMDGITEDMFEEDFEDEQKRVIKKEKEELLEVPVKKEEDDDEKYPVDILPDAHYGLLGVQGGNAVPQGHVQDLPDEILVVLFSNIPAQDLYRSISLVCKSWRNVVMDPQFFPWKRLYYRYYKRQKEALKEVQTILLEHNIDKKDDLCILNLLRLISQFKHSKRVNAQDVLECVKTHRLYAHAEICLKHRLPDMVEAEGPNPWSIMTLMMILADGVKDVLSVVTLLRNSKCLLTAGEITEYLWALATLFLAMREIDIKINSRWHYNIFYVLHLLENSPPHSGTQERRRITHEQQQILNHNIQNHHVVKIMAFAGTGKTTTLVKYAEKKQHLRFLYLAFNKSVATEAQNLFPVNVTCKTVHSLAYRAVGVRYKNIKKLSSTLQPFNVAWVLPKGFGGFVNAKVVTQTVNSFLASADQHVGCQHVPHEYKNTNGQTHHPTEEQQRTFADLAQKIWDGMVDMKPTKKKGYNMTHDGYLKLWQLSKPKLDQYDAIFIDEAQDLTPAIMDIMLSQNCGKIMVGDPHQQIYTFRGAVNSLYTVPHTHMYYLTQSFRFGSEIAYVGASILESCKNVKQILVGGNQDGSVRGEDTEALQHLRLGQKMATENGSVAILCRCNGTIFSEAVRLTEANKDCKIHIVGGVQNFGLQKIKDIWVLMQSQGQHFDRLWIEDYFIRSFCHHDMGGFQGLKKYVIASEDHELESKLNVVEKYNRQIPELVDRIYRCAQESPDQADFVIGTVHKSKGLEFDTVVVMEDFVKVPVACHDLQRIRGFNIAEVPDDEWNLLYVAVTRAKRSLYITKSISNILTLTGEYFLRSERTDNLLSTNPNLHCSSKDCRNHITSESGLTVCRYAFRCVDWLEEGGPLCLTCVEQRLGPTAFLLSSPEHIRTMTYTNERLVLPVNFAMLVALL